MKPMIVFYKSNDDLAEYRSRLSDHYVNVTSGRELSHALRGLESGTVTTMFILTGVGLTGWRTHLTDKQCDVSFAGNNWTEAEVAQGKARVAPAFEPVDFFDEVRKFNSLAGNTTDRFNVRQAALYMGMQLEEMAEKLKHLGLDAFAMHLDIAGKEFKKGDFDFVFETADRKALLDDDVDQLVVTVGSMLSMGVDIHGACAEVCRANMSKVWPDGTLHKDDNGKIVKPEGWTGPDLSRFVRWP